MPKPIDQTTTASGTADDVDTTVTDESELDDDLEDAFDDVTWDDGDDEDDADADASDSAATDDDEDAEEDSDDDVESDDSTETDADDTAAEDVEEDAAPADDQVAALTEQQRRNREAAARRVAAKQQREQAKADAQAKYIAEGKNPTQQAIRQLEISTYNNQIQATTNELRDGVIRAKGSIDLFKSKEPAVQESMLTALDTFEARFVEKDDNGDYIAIRTDPETGEKADVQQFLAKEADRIRKLTSLGAKQQEQAKKTQKKRTATLPTRAPAKKKSDPMMDAFDEEAAA